MILFEKILNVHQNECRANACLCPSSSRFSNGTMTRNDKEKHHLPSNQSPHLQGRIAKCSIDDDHGKETDEQVKPNSAKSCNHIINHPTLPVRLLKYNKSLKDSRHSKNWHLSGITSHKGSPDTVSGETLTLRDALEHTLMPNQVVDHAITRLVNNYQQYPTFPKKSSYTLEGLPWIDDSILVKIEERNMLLEHWVAIVLVAWGSMGMISVHSLQRAWYVCIHWHHTNFNL